MWRCGKLQNADGEQWRAGQGALVSGQLAHLLNRQDHGARPSATPESPGLRLQEVRARHTPAESATALPRAVLPPRLLPAGGRRHPSWRRHRKERKFRARRRARRQGVTRHQGETQDFHLYRLWEGTSSTTISLSLPLYSTYIEVIPYFSWKWTYHPKNREPNACDVERHVWCRGTCAISRQVSGPGSIPEASLIFLFIIKDH